MDARRESQIELLALQVLRDFDETDLPVDVVQDRVFIRPSCL